MGKKKPHAREHDAKRNWLMAFLHGTIGFIVGAVFTLYVVQWFVGWLPGPRIAATLHGLRGVTGKTIGCTYYSFTLNTDEPVEYVYAKFQFPNRITTFKVGLAQEAETGDAGR